MPGRASIAFALFCAGGILLATECRAQTTRIMGLVTDSTTGTRLPHANITVLGTVYGAASNDVGFYLIPGLPPGTYDIAASVVGYARVTRRVLLSEGQTIELNFRLPEATIQSDEVVVTARQKMELLETKTSVHVLTTKDLTVAPVAAQADVLQSLRILPGFVSTSDVSSRFYVRGGAGDQNHFLFNGIRIFSPYHALGIFSIFNAELVDNVEVYTGAFPASYGGKLSSVVNIRARDGRTDRLAGYANVNSLSAGVGFEGPAFGTLTWTLNGRKSISEGAYEDITGQNVPSSFYDVTATLSTHPGGSKKIDLTFLASGDELSPPSIVDPGYEWKTIGFSAVASGLMGDRLFASGQLFGSSYSARQTTDPASGIPEAFTSVNEFGIRALATLYASPSDKYTFGFEFSFPEVEYSYVNRYGLPFDLKTLLPEASVWAGYEAAIGALQLEAALRLELGSLLSGRASIYELQPRLSVSYLWMANWRLKAAFGRVTQRMLTITNEDDVVAIFEGWVAVPVESPPEQADHYVLGATGSISETFSLSLEGYYKRYNSLMVYNREKNTASDPDFIQGTGRSWGGEMTVRSRIAFLDLYAAYALSWAWITNAGLEYAPRYDRRHHLNLLGVVHPFAGLELTARWEFGSGFPYSLTVGYFDALTFDNALPGPFEQETGSPAYMLGPKNQARLPSYHRLDLGVTYDFRMLGFGTTVGASVLNVTDNENIFYVDRTTGQVVNMIAFYPSATLTVRF